MIITRNEMKTDQMEHMRGGEGTVAIRQLVDGSTQKNARLFSEMTLNPGCSIGYHQHNAETEYYFILAGAGTVNDNGTERQINQGDVMVIGNGESHSIKNTGNIPLVLHAVIVTY